MMGKRTYMPGIKADSSASRSVGLDVSISVPGDSDVNSGTNSNSELHMSPKIWGG